MDGTSPTNRPAGRYEVAVDAVISDTHAPAASAPIARQYTDADFARLAHTEAAILGVPESVAWGVVFVVYVGVAGARLLAATSAQAAGDLTADSRFAAFSARWMPGFLLLLVGQGLNWPLLPTAALAVFAFACVAAARTLWGRRSRLHLSRGLRVLLASALLWVLALQLWGFVWSWDRHFTAAEFAVLHLAVPLLATVAILSIRWVRKAA